MSGLEVKEISVTYKNGYTALTDTSFSLPKNAKYQIYFPEISNKNRVDEYLVFIASKKKINWLKKYTKKEDLKSAYIREKSIKYMYKEYTIYK